MVPFAVQTIAPRGADDTARCSRLPIPITPLSRELYAWPTGEAIEYYVSHPDSPPVAYAPARGPISLKSMPTWTFCGDIETLKTNHNRRNGIVSLCQPGELR